MRHLIFSVLFLSVFISACGGGGGEGSGTPTAANTQEEAIYNCRASNLDEETDRVWHYIEQYQWYLDNGYNISFPDDPLIADLINKSLDGSLNADTDYPELQAVMAEIYDENAYAEGLRVLNESVVEIHAVNDTFFKYKSAWASNGWNFEIYENYNVCLTLYGTGGSYNQTTGTIIILVNPDGTFKKDPVSTVIHESVHIAIEEEVVAPFSLSQWVKERIVDRFCFDHFGYSMQATGDTSVDPYLNFPDSWERLPYYVGQYSLE